MATFRSAVFVERHLQILCDHFRSSTFNVMPFNHVNEFSIFEQGNAGRARRVWQHELPGSVHSVSVDTSKSSGEFAGYFGVLNSQLHSWPHGPGCAATDAVQHNQSGAFPAHNAIDIISSEQLFESHSSEIGFHRGD
jgi:hypothetical protein